MVLLGRFVVGGLEQNQCPARCGGDAGIATSLHAGTSLARNVPRRAGVVVAQILYNTPYRSVA